jgi:adenosylcobinamide amidohydrolase
MTKSLKAAVFVILCALVAGCATTKQSAPAPNGTTSGKSVVMAGAGSGGPTTFCGTLRHIGRWWSKATYRLFHPNS